MKYAVHLHTKPYVYHYYSQNELGPLEKAALKNLLCNPSHRDDAQYSTPPNGHLKLNLYISERWFDANIHTLTPTNARILAMFLEQNLKNLFERSIQLQVELCRHHGTPFGIKDILLKVRDEVLSLNEDQWPLESIVKHTYRYCRANKIDYSGLKKLRASVRSNSTHPTPKSPPEGFLYLKDWLQLTNVGQTYFYKSLKKEMPITYHHGKLCVALI